MDLNTSRNNKRKRKLNKSDHQVIPAKKSSQKISIKEQKLLKFHGINSEAKVNLRRVSPKDIKIACQKYVLECKANDSSSKSDNSIDSKSILKTIRVKNLGNNKQFHKEEYLTDDPDDPDDLDDQSENSVYNKESFNNPVADKDNDLKDVRLNSVRASNTRSFGKQESKPLNVKDANDKNDEWNESEILKPPPIREFSLKDFGLDRGSKNFNPPSTSKTLSENIDRYLKEKYARRNDKSRRNEPKISSRNNQPNKDDSVKTMSLGELGLANKPVLTLGLNDFNITL